MKFSIFTLLPLLASAAVLEGRTDKPGCHANNCARAVTGTRYGPAGVSSHKADCSSFQRTTITPKATTVTTTLTHTTTTTKIIGLRERDEAEAAELHIRQATVTPTKIPTYASACANAAEYKSACSCWGITATTITAATPTSVVSTYVTKTVTTFVPHH